MNQSEKHITIDLSKENDFEYVEAVQGDHASRFVCITLLDNAAPYQLNNVIPVIRGTKADDTTIFNACQLTEDGKIVVELTSQMLSVSGKSVYEIALYGTNMEILTSFPFYLSVTPTNFCPDKIVSTDEYTMIADIMKNVNNLYDAVEDAAEQAELSAKSADMAAKSENAAAESAVMAAESEANASVSENNAKTWEQKSREHAFASGQSELAAKASEAAAADSASAAKTSETNTKASETAAKTSETNAKTSENAAKASQAEAKSSETNAATSATNAEASANTASTKATAAANSAIAAAASATNAKASETAAKTSETNAATSESAAVASAANASSSAATATSKATAASNSATAAKTSETNAKVSETSAKTSETNAAASASSASASAATATQKASTASTAATNASNSATAASGSASTASTKATEASNYATQSKSYAVGGTGTRSGENSDNAKYYYEQARDISSELAGAIMPMGTVTFAQLPALSAAENGWMYNVSNQFTTTADFKEGAGNVIPAGANVYKTADGKWDILAGTPVTGVKGDAESGYRKGNVNLTPENIGALPLSGGAVTGETVLSGGTMVSRQEGSSGVSGYVKIVQIKITARYANYPLIFEIAGRGWPYSRKLYVYFANVNSNDPNLSSFLIDSAAPYKVAIIKSATSTWDIYMQKSESYGACNICEMHKTPNAGFTISYPNTQVSALPDGALEPTVMIWDKSKDADTVDGKHASDLQNYNNLTNKPTSMKNPSALTIQFNGVSQGVYDGSAAKTVNITRAGIGAALYSEVSNGDFDLMTTPGIYTMRWTALNSPQDNRYCGLIVLNSDNDGYIEQIAFVENSYDIYIRSLAGDDEVWTDWKKISNLTPSDIGALPTAGGTITGDLRLKGSGNYGNKLNFGDSDYVHLHEYEDDKLEIKAKTLKLTTTNNILVDKPINGDITGSAATAGKLETARSVGGQIFDGCKNVGFLGYCDTPHDVAEKTAVLENFQATNGAIAILRFVYGNSIQNISLNVNGTGAKRVVYDYTIGSMADRIAVNSTHLFVLNGDYWNLVGDATGNNFRHIGNGTDGFFVNVYKGIVNSEKLQIFYPPTNGKTFVGLQFLMGSIVMPDSNIEALQWDAAGIVTLTKKYADAYQNWEFYIFYLLL